jgi:hypothetical protein
MNLGKSIDNTLVIYVVSWLRVAANIKSCLSNLVNLYYNAINRKRVAKTITSPFIT